jgi:hypothetical protein
MKIDFKNSKLDIIHSRNVLQQDILKPLTINATASLSNGAVRYTSDDGVLSCDLASFPTNLKEVDVTDDGYILRVFS